MFDNFTMNISGTCNDGEIYWRYSDEYDDLTMMLEDSLEFLQDFTLSIPRKKGSIDIDIKANTKGEIIVIVIPNFTKGKDLTLLEFKKEINAILNQKKYANIIKLLGMNISNLAKIQESVEVNYDVAFEGEAE